MNDTTSVWMKASVLLCRLPLRLILSETNWSLNHVVLSEVQCVPDCFYRTNIILASNHCQTIRLFYLLWHYTSGTDCPPWLEIGNRDSFENLTTFIIFILKKIETDGTHSLVNQSYAAGCGNYVWDLDRLTACQNIGSVLPCISCVQMSWASPPIWSHHVRLCGV